MNSIPSHPTKHYHLWNDQCTRKPEHSQTMRLSDWPNKKLYDTAEYTM
jgi:hypothetical protein